MCIYNVKMYSPTLEYQMDGRSLNSLNFKTKCQVQVNLTCLIHLIINITFMKQLRRVRLKKFILKFYVYCRSASIGYGAPPADSVSTLVIIIISAGLGIPVIIIIFGGVFVCIKRRKNKDPRPLQSVNGNSYQPLPESDQ